VEKWPLEQRMCVYVCVCVCWQLSEAVLCHLAADPCSDIKSIAVDLINILHSSDVEP